LLVGEILASLQSFLASLYRLNEAGFFFEIARKNVLHQFGRIAALLGGGVCELRFEFGGGNALPSLRLPFSGYANCTLFQNLLIARRDRSP
jgi:hypothetical protein